VITAEEVIEEYMEHYEVGRLEAIRLALEDIRLAEKELVRLGAEEMIKEAEQKEKGGENNG